MLGGAGGSRRGGGAGCFDDARGRGGAAVRGCVDEVAGRGEAAGPGFFEDSRGPGGVAEPLEPPRPFRPSVPQAPLARRRRKRRRVPVPRRRRGSERRDGEKLTSGSKKGPQMWNQSRARFWAPRRRKRGRCAQVGGPELVPKAGPRFPKFEALRWPRVPGCESPAASCQPGRLLERAARAIACVL